MDWQKIGAIAGVASAALAVIGLIVALVAWLAPQSPSNGSPGDITTAVTTTAGNTAASTTNASAASAKPRFVEKYTKQLRLPSPPMWVTDYVELDEGAVAAANLYEHARKTEFSYTYEGKFSTVTTSEEAKVGLVDTGVEQLTAEQCAEKATTQALGEPSVGEPGTPIKVGAGLCVVTGEGTVARVRVDSIGGPVDEVSKQPTIQLSVTAWKRG